MASKWIRLITGTIHGKENLISSACSDNELKVAILVDLIDNAQKIGVPRDYYIASRRPSDVLDKSRHHAFVVNDDIPKVKPPVKGSSLKNDEEAKASQLRRGRRSSSTVREIFTTISNKALRRGLSPEGLPRRASEDSEGGTEMTDTGFTSDPGMKVKIRQYFRRREGPRDRYLLDGLVAGLRSATCKNLDEKRPSRAETMRTRQWRFARFARRHSFQSQRMRVAMIPLDLHQPLNAQRFCAATHEEKIAIVHEISSNVDIDADMWTVLLFCFAGARADEVKKVIFHTIPSTVDMGMALNSPITCEGRNGLIHPHVGFGRRTCFEHSKCLPAFKKLSKATALFQKAMEFFANLTKPGPAHIRKFCYLHRLEFSLRKSKKILKWYWVCSNEASAKKRFLADSLFCLRHPNGEENRRSVQPTRLYRKRILTPAENTILIVAIGVTIIVALCLVCIVALQCYCSKAQTFGEDGESDSKSSLSPISSPIILEMLKLELERQKRKRRDESIESDDDDSRV
ncbi:hypothetical protein Tcan_07895 [Toxocara canis]|uniref:Uncharacterized protein n=1 Tax=Toxocara canis TaxID=6265 RepID=A0A0B2W4N8_TOXCA|nr:hypothetical protein Tcan_07895 [Toxocara canis]